MVDIDEKDLQNPQLCAEYTQDMYAYLRYPSVFSILHVYDDKTDMGTMTNFFATF